MGDVDAGSLGIVYFHEHVISQPPRHFPGWEPDLVLDDIECSVRELVDFQANGGSCLVDATTPDYGRVIEATAEVARRSGCHVVATAGYNKAAYFGTDVEDADIDALEERVARDVDLGIDGTEHRAGLLKVGSSYYHMTEAEERAARAVCRVQRRTGLPLYTHTEIGTFALEQLVLIKEERLDPERVCIGHLDRNPDPWYLRQVAAHGVYVGIDQVSKVRYAPDSVRIDLIIALLEAGFGKRILVSGDMARRSYLRSYGGGPGLRYIAGTFIPRLVAQLRERGFPPGRAEQVGQDLAINNPRTFLAVG
jgi:phosphotriesterase-related protein